MILTDEAAALAPSEHAMRVELQAQVNRLTWQLESERSRLRDHMVLVGNLQRERDELKTQLTQADRDITSAIERARMAEAHAAARRKTITEWCDRSLDLEKSLATSQAEVARWSVLANDHQDALVDARAEIERLRALVQAYRTENEAEYSFWLTKGPLSTEHDAANKDRCRLEREHGHLVPTE